MFGRENAELGPAWRLAGLLLVLALLPATPPMPAAVAGVTLANMATGEQPSRNLPENFCENCQHMAASTDLETLAGVDEDEWVLHVESRSGAFPSLSLEIPAEMRHRGTLAPRVTNNAEVVLLVDRSGSGFGPFLADFETQTFIDISGRPFPCPTGAAVPSSWPGSYEHDVLTDDGRLGVAGRCDDNRWYVALQDAATGHHETVRPFIEEPYDLVPSADGAVILTWHLKEMGGSTIDLATGEISTWGANDVALFGFPDADGSHVIFQTSDGIYREDLVTGQREVLSAFSGTPLYRSLLDFTADGRAAVYAEEGRLFLSSIGAARQPVDEFGFAARCDATCGVMLILGFGVRTIVIGAGPYTPPPPEIGVRDTISFDTPRSESEATRLSVELASLTIDAERTGPRQIVLARNDAFADALASGVLQSMGPLVLVPSGQPLQDSLLQQLRHLAPEVVWVLGGVGAIDGRVDSQLREMGVEVRRLAGVSRIDTALQVARAVTPGTRKAIVARAFGHETGALSQAWADAISAGALAADENIPVLLTPTNQLPQEVADFLSDSAVEEVLLVGGVSAISSEVEAVLQSLVARVRRVAGSDRFATASAVAAERGFESFQQARGVAVVDAVSDLGWTGGFAAARLSALADAPILLSDDDELPASTRSWIGDGIGLTYEAEAVVITCVTAAVVCKEGREVLGLPPEVDLTFDPVFSSVSPGSEILVTATPIPAGAEARAFGSCLDQSIQLAAETVLVVAGDVAVECDVQVVITHLSGAVQQNLVSYAVSPFNVIVPHRGCTAPDADLSDDGSTLFWVADRRCPGFVEGAGQTLVFADLPDGARTTVLMDDLGFNRWRLTPDGSYVIGSFDPPRSAEGGLVVSRVHGVVGTLGDMLADALGERLFGGLWVIETIGDDQVVVVHNPDVEVSPTRQSTGSSPRAYVLDLSTQEVVTTLGPFDDGILMDSFHLSWDHTLLVAGAGRVDVTTGVLTPWLDGDRHISDAVTSHDGGVVTFNRPPSDTVHVQHGTAPPVDLGLRGGGAFRRAISGDGAWVAAEQESEDFRNAVLINTIDEQRWESGAVQIFDVDTTASAVLVFGQEGFLVLPGPAA